MKKKILWIEDAANKGLSIFTSPVHRSIKYDLYSVLSISEAVEKINKIQFDVVIVDVRMLPGDDQKWINLYNKFSKNKQSAKLGLHFLYSLFKQSISIVQIDNIPTWIEPNKFAVFTVEPDLEKELNEMGIKVYKEKGVKIKRTILIDIIEEVLQLSSAS